MLKGDDYKFYWIDWRSHYLRLSFLKNSQPEKMRRKHGSEGIYKSHKEDCSSGIKGLYITKT